MPDTAEHPASLADTGRVLGVAVGLVALLSLVLTAFTWPPSEIEPRNLPLAIVAPGQVAQSLEAGMTEGLGENAIDTRQGRSRAAAVEAIENRDVYGAFVSSADGTEVLIASAASPQVAQLVTQGAEQMAAHQDSVASPTVTDVVAAAQGDPRGAVFGAGALPWRSGDHRRRDRLAGPRAYP